VTAESASRYNPYGDDYVAILKLAGAVRSPDVRADLIVLAAAYRRLADAALVSVDPLAADDRCNRYLRDAYLDEPGNAPRS
jgi:hypothetical protein